MDEVTYEITWTSGGLSKIEATDVLSSDTEQSARERVLRKAYARMDATPGEAPDAGTEIKMERIVAPASSPKYSTTIASLTIGPSWFASFCAFSSACLAS